MSDSDLSELYQSIILSHNKQPRHYGVLTGYTHQAEGYNPLCGDKITVQLRVEGEQINEIQFESAACAICKASASIMTEAIRSKHLSEVQQLGAHVAEILSTDRSTDLAEDGDLAALAGVRKFPARIKCAILPWHTLEDALRGE
ncbi:MAG: Fe-S cluster assembly sulfur transfer protein SufU [Verrucomicrobiota bacterium]